jgi:DNA-binding ferritin-like protein
MALDFPTMEEVAKASHEQLGRWYRFLLPTGKEQQAILDKIAERFKKLGGMTPEISSRIGHGGV